MLTNRFPAYASPRRQSGVVLFIALMFLVLMTILGFSLYSLTDTGERTSRNFRDADLAFQAAEAALRDAEKRIAGTWSDPVYPVSIDAFDSSCTGGLCESGAASGAATISNLITNGIEIGQCGTSGGCDGLGNGTSTGTPSISGVATQPRYLIQIASSASLTPPGTSLIEEVRINPAILYRITALGTGSSATTHVLLQEVMSY